MVEMRRKDRRITDRDQLIYILEKGKVCRIALNAERAPYIVPLNYGYKWSETLQIYFHSAKEGRKIDLLKVNNSVGFEIDVDHEIIKGNQGCDWGMKYKSLIGIGQIYEIEPVEQKIQALDCIMRHYGFEGTPSYEGAKLDKTKVWRLEVDEMTGKQRL